MLKCAAFTPLHEKNFRIRRPSGSGDYLFLHLKSPTRFFLENEKYTMEKQMKLCYTEREPLNFFGEAAGITHVDDFMHFDTSSSEDEISFRGYP